MINKLKVSVLFPIYLLGFLFAFHTAIPTYIDSSFLNTFIPENIVGVIYMIASAFTLFCFLVMPFILREFGNYKTAIFLVIIDMIVLLGLTIFKLPSLLLISFIINLVVIPLTYFSTDIFIEGLSKNKDTGLVRGVYLTAVNLAWVCSPLISSLVLTNGDYWKVYLASFFFLLPVLLILVSNFRKFNDSNYMATHIWQTAKLVWNHKNLFNIFMTNFLLSFFYSWMTIYTPLYLHKNIGFSWAEIGLVFAIMLLPFVFVQLPLGRLADKKFGEKEILSLGFIIIAISTGVISFISGGSIVLWAVILFITRIGAGMIEIMCDTYFFKKVQGLNANIISFYRMCGPFAYIFGPLVATLMFSFLNFDIRYLFLVLGLIMFTGIHFSLSIKDTK